MRLNARGCVGRYVNVRERRRIERERVQKLRAEFAAAVRDLKKKERAELTVLGRRPEARLLLSHLIQCAPHGIQAALARHLGVPHQTIQKWKTGERPLRRADFDKAVAFIALWDQRA
jgi:hypothetical protein